MDPTNGEPAEKLSALPFRTLPRHSADRHSADRRGAKGRHRLKQPNPRNHLIAAAVATGAVLAVGQPLLSAIAVEQPRGPVRPPEVLRVAHTATPTADADPVTEVRKLQRADDTRAAVVERARAVQHAAAEKIAADKAAADQAAAEKAAAEKAAADKAAADKAAAEKTAADRAAKKKAEARKATAQRVAATRQPRAFSATAAPSTAGVVRPTTGRLTSGFGGRWGGTHNGIDIANKIGTPVVSVMAGTVVEAGPASGFGLWVRVRHDDGTITVYGHVHTIVAGEGTRVAAGQQIATVGNRGQSTGPHLHFEVWQPGGRKVDPLAWLRARGVSL